LDDAYELAHELEFSEINSIFELLAAEPVPSDNQEKLIHSIIVKHQQKILDFSHNFGDKEWRQGISRQRP